MSSAGELGLPLDPAASGRWQVRRLGSLGSVTLGKMVASSESVAATISAPYLRAANVQPEGILALADIKTMWFGQSELESLSLLAGDVVIVEGGQGGFGRAALLPTDLPGTGFQNSIVRFRPDGTRVSSAFVTYVLLASRAAGFVRAYCDAVSMPHFTAEKVSRLRIALPPLAEQCAIADYLDRETAKIDTLVEKQTTMIERLRERQDAVVRRTLLKGLRQTEAWRAAPFGEDAIPAHWRIMPASYICTITTGTFDSKDAAPEGAYPFYVRGREILRLDAYDFNGEAVLTPGDGQGGTGKVFHYASGKFAAHQRVYVFHRFRSMEARYFYRWLSTFLRPVALAGSYTVAMESLRRPLLAAFRVAVPTLDEQREIADYLDRETAKIDNLIAKVERHIELAKERRAALITAAVTGQIDVMTSTKSGDAA